MRLLRLNRRKFLLLVVLGLLLLPVLWTGAKLVKSGHSSIWVPSYFKDQLSGRNSRADETTDLFVLMCDHWEPGFGPEAVAAAAHWLERYADIAHEHRDSQGRIFQYSWFYPIDHPEPEILHSLSRAAYAGLGEIEVHWHHNHDSSAAFEADLKRGIDSFLKMGALASEEGGEPRWCFIHGNWALDGSIEGWCGVPDEIGILQKQGCYADMTFPAVGFESQPSMINRIFRVQDTPEPKSHDRGELVRFGHVGQGLLMLPGPLGMDFRNPLILIENAAIDNAEGTGFSGRIRHPKNYRSYFKDSRITLWDNVHVSVEGRSEWCFVKLHAHGMQDEEVLLGGELDQMLDDLEAYSLRRQIRLHYVTAREACNLIMAAERGLAGEATQYYDLVVAPPMNRLREIPALPGED